AVVLGGVVGRGDHDARVAVVVPGGKAQGRHRHQGVVNADLDAVGSQHAGGRLGKDVALDAAVVADGDGLGAALGLDPVGQALGGLTDDVDIHAVGAGAQHAAQAGGAELHCNSKAVLDLCIVPLDLCQLGLEIGVLQVGRHPALVFIQIHCEHLTFALICFIANGTGRPTPCRRI